MDPRTSSPTEHTFEDFIDSLSLTSPNEWLGAIGPDMPAPQREEWFKVAQVIIKKAVMFLYSSEPEHPFNPEHLSHAVGILRRLNHEGDLMFCDICDVLGEVQAGETGVAHRLALGLFLEIQELRGDAEEEECGSNNSAELGRYMETIQEDDEEGEGDSSGTPTSDEGVNTAPSNQMSPTLPSNATEVLENGPVPDDIKAEASSTLSNISARDRLPSYLSPESPMDHFETAADFVRLVVHDLSSSFLWRPERPPHSYNVALAAELFRTILKPASPDSRRQDILTSLMEVAGFMSSGQVVPAAHRLAVHFANNAMNENVGGVREIANGSGWWTMK
ncbi:unnamed protein product [Cutaneotrichosporon oleaginosum]